MRALPVVFAGDFNERDEQFVDAGGQTGTSRTLTVLRGDSAVNVGQLLPQASRASLDHSLVDHVLIPHELLSRLRSVSCDASGYPAPADRQAAGYSDHLPVVVELVDNTLPSLEAPEAAAWIAIGLVFIVATVIGAVILWRRRKWVRNGTPELGTELAETRTTDGEASASATAENTADGETAVTLTSNDLT